MPTGSRSTFAMLPAAAILSAYSLERIEANGMAILAMNGASGLVSVKRTVIASTFSIDFRSLGIPIEAKYW